MSGDVGYVTIDKATIENVRVAVGIMVILYRSGETFYFRFKVRHFEI